MRRSPSIVPEAVDQDIHLVLDDFGALGRAWRETDEAEIDRETVIINLLDGQYSNPVRVIAFNTAEGWSRDVSEDIADKLVLRPASTRIHPPAFRISLIAIARRPRNCSRCRFAGSPDMPIEFYKGRPLDPDELEAIRQQIEEFDTIDAIDPEIRGIVERNWPHLLAKLPREDDPIG